MCSPFASMALTGLSTISGMQSASNQASAQQAQYNYQAQVADQNVKLAQQQAESNAVAGAQKAQQVYQRSQQIKAQQSVAYSANGLDISAGSPLDILSDTERLGQLDKANTLYDSANNTWAIQNQEVNYQNQAMYARNSAENAGIAGKNNSMAMLLNGVSSIAGQYNQYQQSGALTNKTTTPSINSSLSPTDASGNYFISPQYNNYGFNNSLTKKVKVPNYFK